MKWWILFAIVVFLSICIGCGDTKVQNSSTSDSESNSSSNSDSKSDFVPCTNSDTKVLELALTMWKDVQSYENEELSNLYITFMNTLNTEDYDLDTMEAVWSEVVGEEEV